MRRNTARIIIDFRDVRARPDTYEGNVLLAEIVRGLSGGRYDAQHRGFLGGASEVSVHSELFEEELVHLDDTVETGEFGWRRVIPDYLNPQSAERRVFDEANQTSEVQECR